MASSIYDDILTSITTLIKGLALVPDTRVFKRTIPTGRLGIENLPCICVVPRQSPETLEFIAFGQHNILYPVDVAVIYGQNNRGFDASKVETFLDWRQQIRRICEGTQLPGVSSVWDYNADPNSALDAGLLNNNYDFFSITVSVMAIEDS